MQFHNLANNINSSLFIDNILSNKAFISQIKTRYLNDLNNLSILKRNKNIFEFIETNIDNDKSKFQSLSSFIKIDKTFVKKAIYVIFIDSQNIIIIIFIDVII